MRRQSLLRSMTSTLFGLCRDWSAQLCQIPLMRQTFRTALHPNVSMSAYNKRGVLPKSQWYIPSDNDKNNNMNYSTGVE